MPFITFDRRKQIDEQGIQSLREIQPGDRCYKYYKDMVGKWKDNPRWTTAHEIYKEVICAIPLELEDYVAQNLAWQCFFYFHVLPYEKKAEERNGKIE